MFRPFLRNSHLDNKVGNEFINAESQFNEMAKQMKDKVKVICIQIIIWKSIFENINI